jgi:raffinose/stachyose/melibiose transport system permease protein
MIPSRGGRKAGIAIPAPKVSGQARRGVLSAPPSFAAPARPAALVIRRPLRVLRKEAPYILFTIPALLLFALFMFVPLIIGMPIAFTKWDGFSRNITYIGIQNFINLWRDRYIAQDFFKTLQFTVLAVVFCNVFGLLLAIALKTTSRENNFLRTAIFMPFVISLVLSAFIFSYIYVDVIYKYFGLVSPLGRPRWVIAGLAIIAIWRDTGYCMIIYLAALQSVPQEMYEAALLEGANGAKQFFRVTLPMIVPAFTANITLLLSWGLKLFDYPMAATEGGPGRASESINLYIYKNVFPFYKAGYGQAISLVWIVFIFIFTNLIANFLRKREVEI